MWVDFESGRGLLAPSTVSYRCVMLLRTAEVDAEQCSSPMRAVMSKCCACMRKFTCFQIRMVASRVQTHKEGYRWGHRICFTHKSDYVYHVLHVGWMLGSLFVESCSSKCPLFSEAHVYMYRCTGVRREHVGYFDRTGKRVFHTQLAAKAPTSIQPCSVYFAQSYLYMKGLHRRHVSTYALFSIT